MAPSPVPARPGAGAKKRGLARRGAAAITSSPLAAPLLALLLLAGGAASAAAAAASGGRSLSQAVASGEWATCGGINGPGKADSEGLSCPDGLACKRINQ